jgi:magnesium-transporting ATPase (P-type)
MQGCRLRNTEHAIGVVVYAGKETKMMLNSNAPPSKFSQMDRTINRVVLVIFLIKVFVVFFCAFGFGIFTQNIHPNPFYMAGLIVDVPVNSVLVFFSYFSIFSYFIPISLIVSLEVAKLFQAVFMMWDSKLTVTVGEDSMGLSVKNSNLNDELARVRSCF